MFLAVLSSLCLLSAPVEVPFENSADPVIEQALEVIRNHHLETADGRISFLTEELTPFVSGADQLNQEIQELAGKIEEQPTTDLTDEKKEPFIVLGDELNEKMARMIEMLPALETALYIDGDFQQIDELLNKDTFETQDKETLVRIASLCEFLDSQKPQQVE